LCGCGARYHNSTSLPRRIRHRSVQDVVLGVLQTGLSRTMLLTAAGASFAKSIAMSVAKSAKGRNKGTNAAPNVPNSSTNASPRAVDTVRPPPQPAPSS
jgi:hypothetical protein